RAGEVEPHGHTVWGLLERGSKRLERVGERSRRVHGESGRSGGHDRAAASAHQEERDDGDPPHHVRGSSMTTLVALTEATATTPGFSFSSSAASREIRDTIRCGPA